MAPLVLATTHYEIDRKMQPIKEYGSDRYFFKRYDKHGEKPHIARDLDLERQQVVHSVPIKETGVTTPQYLDTTYRPLAPL